MPISIIAGNWKMNTSVAEALKLVSDMKGPLDATEGVQKVVCPPYISLMAVSEALRASSVRVGAQNLHPADNGAFTGEVSPGMLSGLCDYVILGHSERRQIFSETDGFVNDKVKAALKVGLKPILCVGEQLDDREQGRAESFVESQIRGSLAGLDSPDAETLVVAYEPVWAIGTGRAASPEIAQEMMAHVRSVLASVFGDGVAAEIPLLYGGSVNPDNIADYMHEKDINGALVGGASLNADSFVQIVQRTASAVS